MLPLFSLVVVVSGKQLFVLLQVLTRHIRYIAIMLHNFNITLIFTFICIWIHICTLVGAHKNKLRWVKTNVHRINREISFHLRVFVYVAIFTKNSYWPDTFSKGHGIYVVGRNAVLNEAERCADGSIAIAGLILLENLKLFSRQVVQPHLGAVLQKTSYLWWNTCILTSLNSTETGDCPYQGTDFHVHSAADLCLLHVILTSSWTCSRISTEFTVHGFKPPLPHIYSWNAV